MKWLMRLALFVLGAILSAQYPADILTVIAVVGAISASFFCAYFRGRAALIVICIIWVLPSAFFAVPGFFWPLLTFEICFKRAYPLLAIPLILALATAGYHSQFDTALLLFGIGSAALMGFAAARTEILEEQILKVRDDAAEKNLMLDNRNRELKKAQDYEVRIATLTERSRIARDIHDNVGHMLARAMLQTGAAMAVEGDAKNSSLAEIKNTLDTAMNSIRQSVHDLKDESFDLLGLIQSCIRDFSQYECNLNYDISTGAPKDIQYCFAAVVREAFSNVRRHSNATRVRIDVQEHPAFFMLRFEDNGSLKLKTQDSGGMGLDNMRHRVTELNGRFNVMREKGFGIHIALPKTKGKQI